MNKSDCAKVAKSWAVHLKSTNGAEWNFLQRDLKQDCRDHFPETFDSSTWVTREYCIRNANKLAMTETEFSPGLKFSNRLERYNADLNFSLSGMDPWGALEIFHRVMLPKLPLAEVADRMFVDSPPDQPLVAAVCTKLRTAAP